jgi:hypothetical protein
MVNTKEESRCDLCGKSFESRKQMNQHKHDVHETVNDMLKETKKSGSKRRSLKYSKKMIVISVSILVIAAAAATAAYVGLYYSGRPNTPTAPAASALTVNGTECNANEQLLFHIHTHLDIFINGQAIYIPPQIGIIPDKCIYWLHTHDEKGIIHIESPIKRDFTLGQFFDIWSKKLNNSSSDFANIFGGKSTPDVYVNGQKVTGVNYREIKLHAHDEIALIYGKPPDTIPSSYDFPQGL